MLHLLWRSSSVRKNSSLSGIFFWAPAQDPLELADFFDRDPPPDVPQVKGKHSIGRGPGCRV